MTLDLNARPAVMCFFFSGNIVVLDEVLLLKYKADYIVYFFSRGQQTSQMDRSQQRIDLLIHHLLEFICSCNAQVL